MTTCTRRECLIAVGSLALTPVLSGRGTDATGMLQAAPTGKQMRGAFMILATPYTASKEIDYDDLAREVTYLDRCGVQGMVWPQNTSEYRYLKPDERLRGMEVIARAAKGATAAVVFGVQAATTEAMLEFARKAESLEPDAMIAMPPTTATSLDDFRTYFRALCKATTRPIFIQTTGGARDIEPTVEFIVELAREFPNFGYIKEEYQPLIPRMLALAKHRPSPIKSVFSGNFGTGWPYEMRLGLDGTMTGGAMYADIYAALWERHQRGASDEVRDLFGKLLVMINLDDRIPATRRYVLKKRRIFKTMVSRQAEYTLTADEIAEIEHNLAALKPYLKVPIET